MPPNPWTPNTSSESSAPIIFLSPVQPQRQTTPAARPITNAPGMPTLPAAGVIATRPATAPEAAPSIDGLPLSSHSANVHESTAHAVARIVFMNASAAKPLASRAEPALNPNQPNHSIDAPIIVIVRLWGGMLSRPKPTRLPSTIAPINPATPALICTTVPPAKSSAPMFQMKPGVATSTPGAVYASGPAQNQTMCAAGMYANVNQITRNNNTAENLMSSTSDPKIRQHVIAANVAWNATNTISYIGVALLNVAPRANVPADESNNPLRNRRVVLPKKALPVVNANE